MWRKLATHALLLLIPAALPVLGGCAAPDSGAAQKAVPPKVPVAGPAAVPAARRAPAPAPSAPAAPLVIFLGDSLTAGLGLDENQAYPALLDRDLRKHGVPARVINAGVSGDTTAGGLSRIGWLLGQHPALVVVGLGANDGLRGLPLTEVESNLRQIVERSRAAGARVLLLGMRLPPNYGPYADQFTALYPKLAKELDVPLVPFLLDKVGGIRPLNQADGIHPTAEGQEIVARNVLPYLEKALEETAARKRATEGAG
jgi:acyl-CoA thioesterase-1